MGFSRLTKCLNNFIYEFTEEPDSFETQTEREMQVELERQLDKEIQQQEKNAKREKQQQFYKTRNGGIKKVYKFLQTLKSVRDLNISDGSVPTITCYIPYKAFNKFQDWNHKENNVLKNCGLKLTCVNAEEGYRVYIQ